MPDNVNYICEGCYKNQATEKHHKFSQTKSNKAKYGKLIHHSANIKMLCYDCHHNKAVEKYTEFEFRSVLGKNGIELPDIKKPTGILRRGEDGKD